MRLYLLSTLGFFILTLMSCDAVSDISIVNNTKDTAIVEARANYKFQDRSFPKIERLHDSLRVDLVRFVVPPAETVVCGRAIGGLENDIPFDEMVVHFGTDSIRWFSREEILAQFDHGSFGFETPYRITLTRH